jgi:hypothetical protein
MRTGDTPQRAATTRQGSTSTAMTTSMLDLGGRGRGGVALDLITSTFPMVGGTIELTYNACHLG